MSHRSNRLLKQNVIMWSKAGDNEADNVRPLIRRFDWNKTQLQLVLTSKEESQSHLDTNSWDDSRNITKMETNSHTHCVLYNRGQTIYWVLAVIEYSSLTFSHGQTKTRNSRGKKTNLTRED